MRKIRIPSSVPVKEIFEDFETKYTRYIGDNNSKTEITNIKDSILLLLHFLMPVRIEKDENTGYFKTINSTIFNDLTGKKFKVVKDILMSEDCPIIESDNKYHEGKSYGYKLIDRYFFTGGSTLYKAHGKIIEKYYKNIENNRDKRFERLEFLQRKLTRRITMKESVHLFVTEFFKRFDERISRLDWDESDLCELRKKRQLIETIWRNHLELISDGIFGAIESRSCHRFSSIFTRLKRELRQFIMIDGEDTVEIDLKSSQPYFLNQILNSDFYNKKNDISLKTIFPELYKELLSTDKPVKIDNNNFNYILGNPYLLSVNKFNTLYTGNPQLYNKFITRKIIQNIINYKIRDNDINTDYYSFSSLDNTIKYYLYYDIRLLFNGGVPPLPYMCGNIQELTDVREYKGIPFHKDFYNYLCDYWGLRSDRKEVKNKFQLFLNYKGDRNTISLINLIRRSFPNVNRIVEYFLRLKFSDEKLNVKYKNPFSLLLQRVESYFFLQVGVKSFCKNYGDEPFVTIHDSVIVRESKKDEMVRILKGSIEAKTGVEIGIVVQKTDPFSKIDEMIDKYINDISTQIIV